MIYKHKAISVKEVSFERYDKMIKYHLKDMIK